MKLTALGPNGISDATFHVHAAGCRDIARTVRANFCDEPWHFDADTVQAVAETCFGDFIGEDGQTWELLANDLRFFPCVPFAPAVNAVAQPAAPLVFMLNGQPVMLTQHGGRVSYPAQDGGREDAPCMWFHACDDAAVSTAVHPLLGDVPVCQRHADWIGDAPMSGPKGVPPLVAQRPTPAEMFADADE